jgi:hypothetical protein
MYRRYQSFGGTYRLHLHPWRYSLSVSVIQNRHSLFIFFDSTFIHSQRYWISWQVGKGAGGGGTGHGWLGSSCDATDKTWNMVASVCAKSIHHHYCNETYCCCKQTVFHILMPRDPKNDPVVCCEQKGLLRGIIRGIYHMVIQLCESKSKMK